MGVNEDRTSIARPRVRHDDLDAPWDDREYTYEDDDVVPFRVGERVYHQRFGSGRILRITGAARKQRATIRFDGSGTRELALDVARLEREDDA